MKKVTIERFQAKDGVTFNTKEDCIQYEASLIFADIQNTTKADLFVEFSYGTTHYDEITDYLILNKEHIKEFYKRLNELETE